MSRTRDQRPNCDREAEIESETGPVSRNVSRLEAGEVDIAFVRPPIDSVAVIGSGEVLIAVPQEHPLARFERMTRKQVADLPVVLLPRRNGPGRIDEACAQVWPNSKPHAVLEAPDDEQLTQAVRTEWA